MSSLHFASRIAAGAASVMCLYVAFFLHEDEEGRLKNRLEELWVRVDDYQKKSVSRSAAFLSGMSRVALDILDRLFGKPVFSLEATRSCLLFSFASTFLAAPLISIMLAALSVYPFQRFNLFVAWILVGIFFAFIGCWPAFSKSRAVHGLSYIVGGGVAVVPFIFVRGFDTLFQTLLLVAGGMTIDLLFIGFLRWILRRVIVATHAAVMVGGLMLNLTVAILLNVPLYIFYLMYFYTFNPNPARRLNLPSFGERWAFQFAILFSTNTLDAVCALLVFGIMTVALLHRLVWPLIERPIYAAHRRNLLSNTKFLVGLGFAGLLYALPLSAEHALKFLKDIAP